MFGLLRPCAHGAAKYGIDAAEWRTHMCGLCLGLRDEHGQMARATTNVDAIVLSMLTEAQSAGAVERTTAGRCALRGMQRASVAAATSPGVRLATTASLLLASAKVRDHVDDGDASALARTPMAKAASRWAGQARLSAQRIGLDVEPLVAALSAQTGLEQAATAGGADSLARLTEPTQLCASEFFAHTAVLADRPANVDALRAAGWQFGRIAHLADAVQDYEQDLTRGRFNPLAATGTTMPQAYDLLRESDSRLREAVAEAELDAVPTVRWMLLDPLAGVLRRLGRGIGTVAGHACGISHDSTDVQMSARRTRHRRPGIGESLALILGGYCTGYACCAEHTQPCTGERKDAWLKDCNGDCGDCCHCDCCGCDC
ncbi:DUF5685 family protein [Nocardia sp. CS682]|uniref:DUF5685 family protein n=1 Tax=Nocardia sp. CS682 TaxID=1047172 RepID=UPI00107578CA|nr:DUF5685 family protein [Nocardia sp. CS682]QBS42022.1 regulator [Nocardia sp. CS682]